MASNANFISQFVMGGDPCTYKESGELQAEMSKLTHPARPDVDWRRVEKLSLALFRQNGVELQTQVCYVLAITRRQGLAGMADGLGSLDILLQRWADFWPVQVHSRISLLSWVTEKMQQALRTLDIQYQDLPQIYRCVQHLSAIETTLQQCELWHMTKLDVLAGQFRNTALRLERLAPQGAETTITPPELPRREMKQPEKSEESPQPVFATRPAQQNDKDASPSAPSPEISRQRTWPIFMAGMVVMACLGGTGLWGWSQLNQPDALIQRIQLSVMPLPQSLESGELAKLDVKDKALLAQDRTIAASQMQLEQLNKLPARWPLEQGYRQLRQLDALWPDNPQVRALNAQWRKQRELSALSTEALNGYAQAQSQLQRLSAQLDALDPAEQIAMMRIKGRQLKSDPDWRNRSGSILKKQYARRDILKNRVWERSPSIKSVSVELKTEAIRRMKNRKVVGEKVQDIADDLNVSLSRLYHWLKM
ncbi:VasL domain-containing protein [Escherichia coli]|uniref:VasL domain-containing protein n=6 Tax=Bacteria TaxID=2 RepID=UPI0014324C4B|nr:type VI secretion system protein VasL [Escherichia coli]